MWGQGFHDRPMVEGGVALTIEPGICDLAEVLPHRYSAIAPDTHLGNSDQPVWVAAAGPVSRVLQRSGKAITSCF